MANDRKSGSSDFWRNGNTQLKDVEMMLIFGSVRYFVYIAGSYNTEMQSRKSGGVYCGTCNRKTLGYSKPGAFTPIF